MVVARGRNGVKVYCLLLGNRHICLHSSGKDGRRVKRDEA